MSPQTAQSAVDLLALHRRDRDEMVRLFSGYPFKGWQQQVQGIDPCRLAQLLWDLVEPRIGRSRTTACVAWRRRPREALALGILAPHPWHSEVFGRAMGRILHLLNYVDPETAGPPLLDALLSDARASGIEHLACRVDGEDWPNIHLLESRGFYCVDCSLKMARRLDDLTPSAQADSPDRLEIRPFEPTDLHAMQQIAAHSHTHNHFYNDPQLQRDRATVLFQQWLERCARGTAASILVAEDAPGKVVGFVTVLSNAQLARVVGVSVGIIDYIVVDREAEGRGIGRALLQAALHGLADRHQWAELRTSHDNYRALAFYCAAGFRVVASDFILHLWEPLAKTP